MKNTIDKERINNILSPYNNHNIIPTRRNKRDLIQSYYSSIKLDCEGDIACNTRPLSILEEINNKVFYLSELYLTDQIDQIAVKSKFGKTKLCDFDNISDLHYWINLLGLFYMDIIEYSNTCKCVGDDILKKFEDRYKIDCILENITCRKDQLGLLFNKIYKVFLSNIPRCDSVVSIDWTDEYYCICDAPVLPPITITSIVPTYRTLDIYWEHNATGILYLIEVLNYNTQETITSTITSDKNITIEGLSPDTEYTIVITASNCNSRVTVSQNQETLPVFITVNLIDNRQLTTSVIYNLSFIGTRQLDENEIFSLDFILSNIDQQPLDVFIPNSYSYFSKLIISDINGSTALYVNNQTDSNLTKLDNYLGLLSQGRYRTQPLINTTIDVYIDEISYLLDNPTCDSNSTLTYNTLEISNSGIDITIPLPSTLTSIQNQVNTMSSELFISGNVAQTVLDSYQELNSSVCCKDPALVPSNISISNITDSAFTINLTSNPVATTTILIEDAGGTVFEGPIGSGTTSYTVNHQVGISYSTEYTVTVTVTNCTGTLSESTNVTTNSVINTAQLFVRGGSGAVYNTRTSSLDTSYLSTLPTIDSWTSSVNVSCLENYPPYTAIDKIYNADKLNTNGFALEAPNTGIGYNNLTTPFQANIGTGTFACCTPNLTPWSISNTPTEISATLDNSSTVSQYIYSGKFLGIRPIPQPNLLRLEVIISTNNSGGHTIASDMELYLLIDGNPVINGVQFNLAPGYYVSGPFHTVPYDYSPATLVSEGEIEAYVLIRSNALQPFNPANKSGIKIWYQIIKN